jgi:fructose-1,6-bisphosphatase/inositol monophosphatase family enzyme
LTFFQGLEAFHLNRTVVDEYILATFLLDKAETFIVVEPLDGTRNSFA